MFALPWVSSPAEMQVTGVRALAAARATSRVFGTGSLCIVLSRLSGARKPGSG